MDEASGALVKHYGNSSKDVADQIHRSVDKVREKFQWTHGKGERLIVDYLIYCPDYQVKSINAAGINASRVVDASQKDQLAKIIESLCLTSSYETVNYHKVENFFRQTFELVPDIHAHKEKLDKSFIRQSGALVSVLANLEMQPFRLRIREQRDQEKVWSCNALWKKKQSKASDSYFYVLTDCWQRREK